MLAEVLSFRPRRTALRAVALAACALCVLPVGLVQADESEGWTLDAATWARPRSGRAVVSMAPLPRAVRQWSEMPEARIVIHYPGGEDGELWAFELRDWLVALGVPSGHLRTEAGGNPGHLRLELRE